MAQLRDASPAKGQGNKATTNNGAKVGVENIGNGRSGHTKSPVPRTLATRKPRKWGGS